MTRSSAPAAPRDADLPLAGEDRALRVREMFARIVPHYDLMNRLMTGGQDIYWRRLTAAAARPRGAVALDLATGTGDLALELYRQGAARVVGADYCAPMVEAAAVKLRRRRRTGITLAVGDALALPFADATFDCVTSGFLLRNVVDLEQALREMRRVLRPGGRIVALEITHAPLGPIGGFARWYFRTVVPVLGRLIGDDDAAYRYLPASVDLFPNARRLAQMFEAAGFADVHYRRLSLGCVAIHRGTIPR
jgi:demethylmenaquinone methyltransferase / 2-methoxy-6-polyprenyl-1,4-benzoquinol methylase